jgi:hypothetical protein
MAGHSVVAARRGIKPIPFGIGERLDGLMLTGSALRVSDRRERRGDDEGGGKSNKGLGEHCDSPAVVHTDIGVTASSLIERAWKIVRMS